MAARTAVKLRKRGETMKCILCGNESELYICENCTRANNDPRTLKIWEKNKALAEPRNEKKENR